MTNNPGCLIITPAAQEYAQELDRVADTPVPYRACSSADEALAGYKNETILFGRPDMIAEILPGMPNVDWVQSSWAGVTPLIDLARRDYRLTGIKDVFGAQMAEYVIAYLLAHELRVIERRQAQLDHRWSNVVSGRLQGKRLGIMGTGSIGRYIATKALFLDMSVVGFSRSGKQVPVFSNVFPERRLKEFLKGLDYLVTIIPDTPGTTRLLDANALGNLPKHAYLVNIGRSNIVDDDALISALANNELAGATLDVFDEEPLPDDSPLWDAPNLNITAHIAAISYASLVVPIFIDNYRRYVNDQPLHHIVDFDAGY